ncbi:MAG: Uma2 family endonuclease [Gemmataceae bacterium]|nr:Uma2 family endonuclease [Gemmataceae bacterium]
MSATVTPLPKPADVHYPDSNGQPIADNTLQFAWILTIYTHLAVQYRDDPNTFVAGDNLIYPVEGENKTRQSPDVYVAFGRPKGHRGSYRVWDEGGVFPQVVFEVWSPGNRTPRCRTSLPSTRSTAPRSTTSCTPSSRCTPRRTGGTAAGWCGSSR